MKTTNGRYLAALAAAFALGTAVATPCLADSLHATDEEYTTGHVHSMINTYRGEYGARYVVETNARIDTKYRAWKRNVDLINSLLALPKGLNEAGR